MKKGLAGVAVLGAGAIWITCGLLLSCGEPTGPERLGTGGPDTGDTAIVDTGDTPAGLVVPDTIDFGSELDTVRLAVSGDPACSFTWTTYAFHEYLSVSDSGRCNDSLTVAIDRSAERLQTGWNYGYWFLYTDDDSIGQKKVVVRVMKLAAGEPQLSVTAVKSDFGLRLDSIYCSVHNGGGGKLIWNVETPAWLHAVPDSGVYDGGFRIHASRRSLEPGLHLDTLRVRSNGGDTAIAMRITIPLDTLGHPITEYWPLTPGNRWLWLNPSGTAWWAIEVADTFSREGRTVRVLNADNSDGGYGTYYATVANGVLTVTGDSTELAGLDGVSYPNCGMIPCWERTYPFGLFALPLAAGPFSDPYWKSSGEYVPGSLEQLMGTHEVWSNPGVTTADLAIGSLDTCMGLKEWGVENELYTILGKGVGPIIWDGYTLVHCRIDGIERGSIPELVQAHSFAVNQDTTNELLYWFTSQQETRIYFKGYRHEGMPVPNHLVFENEAGEVAGTLFLRADFLPVMWILDTLTIGIHNTNAVDTNAVDTAFDPTNAYHMVLFDNRQVDFTADIYPHDPRQVLDSLEWILDMWLTHIRDELDAYQITDYKDLIACGYIDSPLQARFQVIATFIAMGAAMVAYEMSEGGGLAKGADAEIPGPFVPDDVKEMAKKIAEYLEDELTCKYCPTPGVPTVRMLHCQGLKTVLWTGQVCHDSYMSMRSASRCLELCKVSTMCFTEICMPRDVAAADVEKVLFENNLGVTPEDVEDMVRSRLNEMVPMVDPF